MPVEGGKTLITDACRDLLNGEVAGAQKINGDRDTHMIQILKWRSVHIFVKISAEGGNGFTAHLGKDVGICWDFGHANLMGMDQREALRVMGKRLKATHVADNSGILDDHILPFQGTVNWRNILPVLGEIGYEGDLTYEIHCSTSRLPDELVYETAVLCEHVGRYLLALACGE